VVSSALRHGSQSIAYTYTEPTIFFEYARDVALAAQEDGLKNIFVTNGYMTPEALEAMGDWLDAANVDLKSAIDDFYRRVIGGRLGPVKESIRLMHQMGVWVEVTTLLIPDQNDDPEELAQIAEFLAGLDPNIPWHISRFIPHYRMLDSRITPAEAIHRAVRIGQEAGLRYVYAGNLPGSPYEDTLCPSCGEAVIERTGYAARAHLDGDRCEHCGQPVAVITG
jgi:pyruvate formate lyase activating enzyme